MNERERDGDPTTALDAMPSATSGDDLYAEQTETVPGSASQVRSHFNDPRQILPVQTYKGASLWRKLVAVLGLGAFTVLGGLAITLIVGIIAIVGALVVQAAIS